MPKNNVNTSEILKDFIEKPLDIAQFRQLGYFLSNQDEHKYNLGYYTSQYQRYIDFSTLLSERYKLVGKLLLDFNSISSVCNQTTHSYHVYIDNIFVIEKVDLYQDNSSKWEVKIDPKLSEDFGIQQVSKSNITVKVVKRDVKNILLISDYTKLTTVIYWEKNRVNIDETYYSLRDTVKKAINTLSGKSNKEMKNEK